MTSLSLDVLANSASQAKLDEEMVNYRVKMKSTGYLSDAALYRNQGIVAGQQGQLSAASYLLSNAGQAAYAYAQAGGGRTEDPAMLPARPQPGVD
jgi:hypothetical protein